jgi:NodT family efflux transporter outer membrane factor (OMF) lipoprotein
MSMARRQLPVRCAKIAFNYLICICFLSSCVSGSDYKKPVPLMPVTWKVEEPFRPSNPSDGLSKGPWWERFGDARLNALQQQALKDSPNMAVAAARLSQATALLNAAGAGVYPSFGVAGRDARTRLSASRPLNSNTTPMYTTTQSDFVLALTASYEVDLAGRVARTIEGARATAEQTAADLENVRLLLTADLATAYFNLRAVDIELDVLSRSIALQRKSLELASSRFELGATSGLDKAQQQALLDNTLTQVDVLRRQRAQFQNALATLTGTPAPLFSLAPDIKPLEPPQIPLGVPSDLLERRPDVAAAERAMAAANAQIGVASAGFYPSILLGGLYGSEARRTELMWKTASYIWSLGLTAAFTIFDGGRLRGLEDSAKAGYEVTAGNYRRVVLTAMQEAEDGILGLAALERAHLQAQAAISSANRVLELATARYEGGIATSLDVILAQQGLLNSERQAAQLQGQRLLTSVFLVKALGGDWQGTGKLSATPKN